MNAQEYQEYLKTPEWKEFRKKVIAEAGGQCERCDCKGTLDNPLVVHHKRYVDGRKPWEYEEDDLMVLCRNCHEEMHRKLAIIHKQVPVFDERGNNLSDRYVCLRCNGDGFFPAYEDFCGGECFRCRGSGSAIRAVFDIQDVERQVDKVWDAVLETGRIDKFPTREKVKDWLLSIHDMKK